MKIIIKTIKIALTLLMMSGCSDTGIFYSLEKEVKTVDNNNLDNKAHFLQLVDTNPNAATGYYIGNAGPNLYYRSKASSFSPWSTLPLPGGFGADATNTSIAFLNNGTKDLLLSRISNNNGSVISKVFHISDITNKIAIGTVSISWIQITVPGTTSTAPNYDVYKLFSANTNDIYINHLKKDSEGKTTASLLHHSSDIFVGDTDVTPNISITTEEVEKILYDGATHYWLIFNDSSKGTVHRGVDAIFSGGTDITGVAANKLIDIFTFSAAQVILANNVGSLYITSDANIACTWSALGSSSGNFNGFANISAIPSAPPYDVIVGTVPRGLNKPDGYYQIDMTGPSISNSNFSNLNNYISSELSDSPINGFLRDAFNSRLFAYTPNNGVWLNVSNNWTQE